MTNQKYTCLLVVLLGLSLCGGCGVYVFWPNHTTQLFDYAKSTMDSEALRIGVSMGGTNRGKENLSVRSSPYDVLVSVRFFDGQPHSVQLERARLLTSRKRHVVLDEEDIPPKEPQLSSNGGYCTYYRLTDLELDYEDYVIVLDLVFELDGETTREQVELRIEKDYREYRTSRLMRVLQR